MQVSSLKVDGSLWGNPDYDLVVKGSMTAPVQQHIQIPSVVGILSSSIGCKDGSRVEGGSCTSAGGELEMATSAAVRGNYPLHSMEGINRVPHIQGIESLNACIMILG